MIQYCKNTSLVGQQYWYGIDLFSEKDGNKMILDSVPDLTQDLNKINLYLEMLNQGNLSPVHFRDVVEDWLIGVG